MTRKTHCPDANRRFLAERIARLNTESAFTVLSRAQALESVGRSVIHLEIGQPDFRTPEHICEAAFRAVRDGATGYCATEGIAPLREAVAEQVSASRGVAVSPSQVIVASGAKPLLFYAALACLERGDEVITPDPGFPIYESVVRLVGATPVPLPLREAQDFRFDADELRRLVSPKTRMLILNSPQNPTGSVLGGAELGVIAELARRYGFWVLADEVYSQLTYDEPHRSIFSYDGMPEQTILVDGASKTYAMTGWRLGWGVMPERLVEAVARLIVNSNSCVAAFVQHGGVAALRGPQDTVEAMRREFRARRDLLVEGLNRIRGIRCRAPQGAFYAFPNVAALTTDDRQFAERLLDEAGVAALWGSSFGGQGKGFLRLSYANSRERLSEALARIGAFVEAAYPPS